MKTSHIRFAWFLAGFFVLATATLSAQNKRGHHADDALCDSVLQRVFSYRSAFDFPDSLPPSSSYLRYHVDVKRRNLMLEFVPFFKIFASGKKHMIGESFREITFYDSNQFGVLELARKHTLSSRGARQVPSAANKLTPSIYDISIFRDQLLSPFNRINRRCYIYQADSVAPDTVLLRFKPRVKNPQLIGGEAVVERATGRVVRTAFDCQHDMLRLHIDLQQGREGIYSLLPESCSVASRFRFFWNKIDLDYQSRFLMPELDSAALLSIDSLRPYPLNDAETQLYAPRKAAVTDSTQSAPHNRQSAGKFMRNLGYQLIKDHSTDFGQGGHLNISPIFNPFYFTYTANRGFAYRMRLRSSYRLKDNQSLTLGATTGIYITQKRIYYEIPLRYNFNERRQGRIALTFSNGNRIADYAVLEEVKRQKPNSDIDFDSLHLDHYKNTKVKFEARYAVTKFDVLTLGVNYYRRSAIDRHAFELAGRKTVYHTFAPFVELAHRLWNKGPMLTTTYEQALLDVLGSDNRYGKLEVDLAHKISLQRLRTLSLRAGAGKYLFKENNRFLQYENFRDQNLPEGWNDEWSGEFQLLNQHRYNASDYYLRGNITYESPMLLLSWLPVVGRYLQMERFYGNLLSVRRYSPYSEVGYGFTTKYFSLAAYAAFLRTQYKEFGCKFTIELFR